MKKLAWLSALLVAAACGDDSSPADPDGSPDTTTDAEASQPDAEAEDSDISGTTTAYTENAEGDWEEVGPANWECLGDPDDVEPTQNDITLSGEVTEFLDGDIEEVAVAAYDSTDLRGDPTAGPVDAVDPDPEDDTDEILYDGLVLPAGVTRVVFRIETSELLTSFSFGNTYDPQTEEATEDLQAVSESTASTLAAAALQRDRTEGLGIIAGDLYDCNGDTVMHAVGALSQTSGEMDPPEDVERTYYFGGLLPVRSRTETQEDGRFLIPELEPREEPVYVQAWGYPDEEAMESEELVLLSELETTIPADGLITASFEPLYSDSEQ